MARPLSQPLIHKTILGKTMEIKNNTEDSPGPIILDVEGLTLNQHDIRRIQHPLTGGVILFGRNFQSRKQLTALTKSIKEIRSDILICIDHEGGRVQRCKTDGFTHLPAMRRLSDLWMRTGTGASSAITAMKVATACGYVLATELRACGVDFSFTPVLDLDFGRSGVIGDRSFHRNPEIVYVLAKSLNEGLRLGDMANCSKHFPGHGWAEADSHVAIPKDERSLKAIESDDMKPYEWLDISLASVMPAHVIYPQVDALPAGFSRIWLQTILRNKLKFNGVIFSDDLSMEGASVAGDVVQGAQLALKAGCDAVLICNRPDLADRLLNELSVAPKKITQSALRLKKLFPKSESQSWDELQRDIEYLHSKNLLNELRLIK
jgi:beta-N-acetylhexosaminidase